MSNLIKRRWYKAKFFGWLLQTVPFIKLIAVTGSLARGQSRSSSDIDFFIIGKAGHLWTVRFLSLFLTQILGQRTRGKNTAGKICLNRFLADGYLMVNPHNKYHAEEYSQLVVLFNTRGTYSKFLSSNQWMKKYTTKKPESITDRNDQILKIIRSTKEFFLKGRIGDWLEGKLKYFQLTQISNNPFYHQKGSRLVINNNEIFFHDKPR